MERNAPPFRASCLVSSVVIFIGPLSRKGISIFSISRSLSLMGLSCLLNAACERAPPLFAGATDSISIEWCKPGQGLRIERTVLTPRALCFSCAEVDELVHLQIIEGHLAPRTLVAKRTLSSSLGSTKRTHLGRTSLSNILFIALIFHFSVSTKPL